MTEAFGRFLNVVDVEATCWEGDPPPGQVHEIIEIGLTVVELERQERVERARILVRPERSEVGAFCTRLTGITAQEVEGGVTFREACRQLEDTFRSRSRAWASWGDYDRKQVQRQCTSGQVAYPFSSRHTNVKAVFTGAYGLKKRPGMDGALSLAGLPLEGRHHRGEDDAWNIAALVMHLMERGAWPAQPSAGQS
ncbi:DNA polymerase III [Deinococcus malanensis]|uniref:DNA polymerase III n=1 Tax=Deinococcus malanensis TaxID=1706855 RepID=A0ABQ2ETT6_9DEIO|nr:3'-5' exonuclease [Deinococcus malanensis]GGK24396.1 DNA polymerase III [Deinococcus malanensis]